MKEPMTLEQFWREHPNDVIQIMSPGGYVTLSPNRPPDQLSAHAGVRGTEMPISWDELKDQVIQNCSFDQADESWYLFTVEPSLDCPTQTLGM